MAVTRKAQRILELAMKINNTPTERELTGDKPTVFVWFSGHVNMLDVEIYQKGWDKNTQSDCSYRFDLSNANSDDERTRRVLNKRMDNCITQLKDIWCKYKPAQIEEVSANAV